MWYSPARTGWFKREHTMVSILRSWEAHGLLVPLGSSPHPPIFSLKRLHTQFRICLRTLGVCSWVKGDERRGYVQRTLCAALAFLGLGKRERPLMYTYHFSTTCLSIPELLDLSQDTHCPPENKESLCFIPSFKAPNHWYKDCFPSGSYTKNIKILL